VQSLSDARVRIEFYGVLLNCVFFSIGLFELETHTRP
jgi:hypothetical protein